MIILLNISLVRLPRIVKMNIRFSFRTDLRRGHSRCEGVNVSGR
jgi:hypothetical protein